MLQRTDASQYQTYLNPGGGALPANYTVTATIPESCLALPFFGLVGRYANGTGVRVLWTNNRTTLTMGDASDWGAGAVTVVADNAYPASWSQNVTHTVAIRMTGTLVEVFADGVLVAHATITTNAALTGTSYGFCGEGVNRLVDSVATSV